MAGRIQDKVAIVTGAGSVGPGIGNSHVGNGRATALVFAREGARVLLVDRDLAPAEETRRMIAEAGGESSTFQADVSDAADCRAIAGQCIERYGRIDILHNNVGIEIAGGLAETTEEAWDRTLAVNLKSMFLMAKAVVPHMERQRSGAIVNISSIKRHPHAARAVPAVRGVQGRRDRLHPRRGRRVRGQGHPRERRPARHDGHAVRGCRAHRCVRRRRRRHDEAA